MYMKRLVWKNIFPHLNCHVVLNHVKIKNIHIFGTSIKLTHISRTPYRSPLFVVTNFVETSLFL